MHDDDLFESAFRYAAIGMALVALDGRWLKVNAALCRVLGYSEDELMQLDFQTVTHPDDLAADLALVAKLVAGEIASYDLEKRYVRKDRRIVWVLLTVSLVRSAAEGPKYFVAQVQDITRRREVEADLRAFFDASPDMLAIAGNGPCLETVSKAWEKHLGWTAAELTSRPFLDFVHEDDRAATVAEAQAVRAGHPTPGFRNRYRTKTGEVRWLEWSTTRLDDGRLYSIARDVSAQEAAEQPRRWLAALVDGSDDGIFSIDAATNRIASWNDGAERLLGYTAAEMIGLPPAAIAAGDESIAAEIDAVIGRARDGQVVQRYDARRRRKDGSSVDVGIVVSRVRGEDGRAAGWVITMRDVSEHKRLVAAVEAQSVVYRTIARQLPRGAVVVFDARMRIVAVGGELLAAFGRDEGTLVGQPLAAFAPDGNRVELERMRQATLAGEAYERELDWEGRALLLRTAPISAADGSVAGGIILALDVTERRRQAVLLRAVARSMPNSGVIVFDRELKVLLAEGAKLVNAPRPAASHVGSTISSAAFGDASAYRAALDGVATKDEVRLKDRVFERHVQPVHDDGGEVIAGLVLLYDVTADRVLRNELDKRALTDALTGLPNRRAAEIALERSRDDGTPLAIALIDVDRFKAINDGHGHRTGDRVLVEIARLLAAQARAGDIVARWGGEEFLAVLRTSREGAFAYCERARKAVARAVVPGVGQVTVSAGVTTVASGEDIASALSRADALLYEAKGEGRNRVAG